MKKIELDSYKIKFLSEDLKEITPFIRNALNLTFIPKLSVNSHAKTISEACDEFSMADDKGKKKVALRNWINLSLSLSHIKTVYGFIPEKYYVNEKNLAIRKMAEFLSVKKIVASK